MSLSEKNKGSVTKATVSKDRSPQFQSLLPQASSLSSVWHVGCLLSISRFDTDSFTWFRFIFRSGCSVQGSLSIKDEGHIWCLGLLYL